MFLKTLSLFSFYSLAHVKVAHGETCSGMTKQALQLKGRTTTLERRLLGSETLGSAAGSVGSLAGTDHPEQPSLGSAGTGGSASENDLLGAGQPPTAGSGSAPVFLPVYADQPLDERNSDVTTAIIWVHGLSGNADHYFCSGHEVTKESGRNHYTIDIAPWFGDTRVTGEQWTGTAGAGVSTYWSDSSWLEGGNVSGDSSLSSFDALEALVGRLSDRGLFPNLERIAVVGHSAGAQLVSRYAFFESSGETRLRFITANASSWMYLGPERPASSCSPGYDTGKDHTCSSFPRLDIVGSEDDRRRLVQCSEYNDYKYGLDLAGVTNNRWVENVRANSWLLEKLLNDFPSKDYIVMLGDEDNCNCNSSGYTNPSNCFHSTLTCKKSVHGSTCCDTYPDAKASNVLVTSCEAMMQGQNRLQRGLNYISHLREFYKERTGTPLEVPSHIFPGGHDNEAFYASKAFKNWVYDKAW